MFLKLNSTKLMMTNQYRCGPKTEKFNLNWWWRWSIDIGVVPKLNSTELEMKMTDIYRCGPKIETQVELEMKMTDQYRCGLKTELN